MSATRSTIIVAACGTLLTAAAANAGVSFYYPYTFGVAQIADLVDNDPSLEQQVDSDGYYDAAAQAPGASARIIGADSLTSYTASSDAPEMFALAFGIESFLAVTQDADVLVSWDFSGELNAEHEYFIGSHILIEDFTRDATLLQVDLSTPVGSELIQLVADRQYFWTGAALAVEGGGTSWFTISLDIVPAPGPFALAALTALAFATRRTLRPRS